MNFTITGEQILWLCGFIVAVWGVIKVIKEIKKPNDDLKTEVARHTLLLDEDNDRLKAVEDSNKMILQCLLVIINHDLTGNGVDRMKEVRDELQEFIINR